MRNHGVHTATAESLLVLDRDMRRQSGTAPQMLVSDPCQEVRFSKAQESEYPSVASTPRKHAISAIDLSPSVARGTIPATGTREKAARVTGWRAGDAGDGRVSPLPLRALASVCYARVMNGRQAVNPFVPGRGHIPPYLAGREAEQGKLLDLFAYLQIGRGAPRDARALRPPRQRQDHALALVPPSRSRRAAGTSTWCGLPPARSSGSGPAGYQAWCRPHGSCVGCDRTPCRSRPASDDGRASE